MSQSAQINRNWNSAVIICSIPAKGEINTMDQIEMIREHAPCFVYDREEIVMACNQLKTALPEFDFLYSVKANPFDPVVRLIADTGFGADAASPAEVEKALISGVKPEDIYYSAPGKTEKDIRRTLGKCTIIADSLRELELIERIGEEKAMGIKAGIRVHPGFAMQGKAGASKFGIDMEQLPELKKVISRCAHVRICGIHIHLQSQILNSRILIEYYNNVMETALLLSRECGTALEFINFGSGIGIVYNDRDEQPVDLQMLRGGCEGLIRKNRSTGARLLMETGRFVTCRAGKYYTPVLDKKVSHGKTYLIVSSGLNGFMRTSLASMLDLVSGGRELPGMEPLYTAPDAFQVKVIGQNHECETVDIVGNLCTSMDVIARSVCVKKAEPGDLVEISNAGSYGMTLSPLLFAGHRLPEELLL